MRSAELARGRVFVLRLTDGEVLHETIESFCRDNRITNAVVHVTGAVGAGSRMVSGPRTPVGERVEPIVITLDEPCEITGSGTVFPDGEGNPLLHLHGTAGRAGFCACGDFRAGMAVWLISEVIIEELTGSGPVRLVSDSRLDGRLLEIRDGHRGDSQEDTAQRRPQAVRQVPQHTGVVRHRGVRALRRRGPGRPHRPHQDARARPDEARTLPRGHLRHGVQEDRPGGHNRQEVLGVRQDPREVAVPEDGWRRGVHAQARAGDHPPRISPRHRVLRGGVVHRRPPGQGQLRGRDGGDRPDIRAHLPDRLGEHALLRVQGAEAVPAHRDGGERRLHPFEAA